MFGMQLDRFGCNYQFALYLLIREICVEPLQNLQLAPGQWLQAFFRQEIFQTNSLYRYLVHRCQNALEEGIQIIV